MIFRFPAPVITLSFLLGGLVFLLFGGFARPESGEAYGVLTVDETLADREIGGLLKAAGFDHYYSESATRIYIDDFGEARGLFLDQYQDALEPFDPRDNGYAEKLRSFFVHQGKRRFFIPLEENLRHSQAAKTIGAALGTTPFSLEILGSPGRTLIWLAFQCAAAIAALIFSRDKGRFLLQIPILLAFGWAGVSGLILAGILAGLWELLREPLGEWFTPKPFGTFRERFEPYKYSFRWVLFLTALFVFFFLIWNTPIIPVLTGFFGFFLLEYLSFKTAKGKGREKPEFTPVLIITLPKKTAAFRYFIMIFAFSSLAALTFLLLFPDFAPQLAQKALPDLPNFPSLTEYEEHMAFQSSFSLSPLGAYPGEREYLRYFLGEDGLIAGTKNIPGAWEIPPFPLEKLADFLLNYGNKIGESKGPTLKDWILVALVFLCCIPAARSAVKRNIKKSKIPLMRDRRVAA